MKERFIQNVFLALMFLLASCENNRWEVNTSSIELDLNFQRFELDLWEFGEDRVSPEESVELSKKYPRLFPLFKQGILRFGQADSIKSLKMLNDFVNHKDIRSLFEAVKNTYPRNELASEEEQLTDGFKRYKFHFPDKTIPEVKSMISAFNFSTVTGDQLLAVSLDNYLGKDYEIYPQIGLPEYKFNKFERKYLVSDALKAWFTTEFETEGNRKLIEQMIFNGKILYLLHALLPNLDPWIKFSYNEEELNWCETNESEVWFHFVDMELLYTDEIFKIRKYLGEAPFIAGFPKNSPGKVGQWVGYRIVKAYMDAHPKMSLSELMETGNDSRFLQQSNYKPKRK